MKKLIKKKARKYKLEFELVCAVIWQESRGNPWATRYEHAFYQRYVEPLGRDELPGFVPEPYRVSLSTEKRLRAVSYGLMQLMGETMRESGFRKNDLTRLLIPAINLEYGCRHLQYLIRRASADTYETRIRMALAAYNTGRTLHENTQYDDKVLRHIMTGAYNEMFE